MSKLLRFKKWMTLTEAANHLSNAMGEQVEVTDLLQMALDKHIKISVDLVNHAKANIGGFVPYKDVPVLETPIPVRNGEKEVQKIMMGYLLEPVEQVVEDTPFLVFSSEVQTIEGIWDLAMLGNEAIQVSSILNQAIGGDEVTLINIDGTFLQRGDDVFASLQEAFPEEFEIDISGGKKRKPTQYFPADGVPEECCYIIRTDELQRFIKSVNEQTIEKPLETRERNTLLSIIGVLCKEAGHDITKPAKTAAILQSTAAQMGISLGESTIEGHIKKVADALATRSK